MSQGSCAAPEHAPGLGNRFPRLSPPPGKQWRKPASPTILAVANQKGGVGKTTTAVNLATAFAASGLKTMLIDMDPQGNASTGLGISKKDRKYGSYALLTGDRQIEECLLPTRIPDLSVIPASQELAAADMELCSTRERTTRLRQALEKLSPDTSYVLIDCPPSFNLLNINAMVAAMGIIAPLQCEFYALEGLTMLLKLTGRIRKTLNPDLILRGVVLTMYDGRNSLSGMVASDVRSFLGNRVFETVIPRNVRLAEAPGHGEPALIHDHTCSGSRAYARLAREILLQENKRLSPAAA